MQELNHAVNDRLFLALGRRESRLTASEVFTVTDQILQNLPTRLGSNDPNAPWLKKLVGICLVNYSSMSMKENKHSTGQSCCCGNPLEPSSVVSTAPLSQRLYAEFLRNTVQPGVLDAKTKELIILGVVIFARCEPCLEGHYKKAIRMGITESEIDEVAWCAIAMGGAPVMMFYKRFKEKLETGGNPKPAEPCC